MNTSTLKKFSQTARRQPARAGERSAGAGAAHRQRRAAREGGRPARAAPADRRDSSKEAVIDRVAYTWFNRFCALRFMDVNRYTRIGVVSPAEGFTQPEILQEAKQGVHRRRPGALRGPRSGVRPARAAGAPSSDPQEEAYRLLLVGVCNAYTRDDAVPVRADRRLHRAADAAWTCSRTTRSCTDLREALTAGGLPGCGGDRLAVPVLHLREEG